MYGLIGSAAGLELFPFAETYTAVYEHFNLLRGNTVLAHCVHLEESELELIKLRNSGISHCPTLVTIPQSFSSSPILNEAEGQQVGSERLMR